jgi:hypothetical protein
MRQREYFGLKVSQGRVCYVLVLAFENESLIEYRENTPSCQGNPKLEIHK